MTFESCVFINNSVKNSDGKSSPGSAIYMDSSSSKLSLINNIFYNNHGTEDKGVYNCGKYGTVKNNWYGINDVNFDDAYLIEWHRIAKNEKISDSNSLRITLSANVTEVFHDSIKLTLKFVCSDKTEFTGKLINWTVDFKSNNNGKFSDLKIGDNEATVIFTPEAGDTVVTAKVHGQEVSITREISFETRFNVYRLLSSNVGLKILKLKFTYKGTHEVDTSFGYKEEL